MVTDISQVSSLNLFKTILAEEKAFPKDQAFKDLKNVTEYIIKKFFKATRDNPFLLVEVGYSCILERFAPDALSSHRPSSRRIEGNGKPILAGSHPQKSRADADARRRRKR